MKKKAPDSSGAFYARPVIAGLDPAIHDEHRRSRTFTGFLLLPIIMDARVKPGHDGGDIAARCGSLRVFIALRWVVAGQARREAKAE
jgi:hypothetical protein